MENLALHPRFMDACIWLVFIIAPIAKLQIKHDKGLLWYATSDIRAVMLAYLAAISGKALPGCFWRRECKSPPEQYSITRQENWLVSKWAYSVGKKGWSNDARISFSTCARDSFFRVASAPLSITWHRDIAPLFQSLQTASWVSTNCWNGRYGNAKYQQIKTNHGIKERTHGYPNRHTS